MATSFVERIAWRTIDEFGLTSEFLYEKVMRSGEGPVWDQIFAKVKRMKPSTLGVIAATGKAFGSGYPSLYEVHCGTYLDKYNSGRQILRVLAATALVCKMYELLQTDEELRATAY